MHDTWCTSCCSMSLLSGKPPCSGNLNQQQIHHDSATCAQLSLVVLSIGKCKLNKHALKGASCNIHNLANMECQTFSTTAEIAHDAQPKGIHMQMLQATHLASRLPPEPLPSTQRISKMADRKAPMPTATACQAVSVSLATIDNNAPVTRQLRGQAGLAR